MELALRKLSIVGAVVALASCGIGQEYPKVETVPAVGSPDPVEWETGARPGSSDGKTSGDYGYSDGAAPGAASEEGGRTDTGSSGATSPTGGVGTVVSPPQGAGVLTAGSFDDHLNSAAFDAFLASRQSSVTNGPDLTKRAVILVSGADGKPVPNAAIQVIGGGAMLLSTRTGSDGRALFLPAFDGEAPTGLYDVHASAGGASVAGQFSLGGAAWTLSLPGTYAAPTSLDLAFVVDTTGSMSDELEFLKAEISHIVGVVDARFPATDIRLGLIVYRDEGDEYVTRGYGFVGLSDFQARLSLQASDGGGDEPEAVHTALSEAVTRLPWRQGNVVKMLFHVADAAPHDESLDAAFQAASQLRAAGIRGYPVAASGTSDLAEYFMRSEAFMTLGRFLFLTDDSGVGSAHSEPRVPCYDVERLENLMIRMIGSELAGELLPADPSQVLRSVGTPVNGVCVP